MDEAKRDKAGLDDEPPGAEETLRGLEARLMHASLAAERLMREAATRVGAEGAGEAGESPLRAQDIELLASLWERIKDLVPPELQRRVSDALRELLLAVRALIDWYLARVERDRPQRSEVKDIPIL